MPAETLEKIKQRRDRDYLAKLLDERAEIKRLKDKVKVEEERLNDLIIPLMVGHDLKMVAHNGVTFNWYDGSNVHIDKKLLLSAGVDPDTIMECTVTTSYTTMKVELPKAGGKPRGRRRGSSDSD